MKRRMLAVGINVYYAEFVLPLSCALEDATRVRSLLEHAHPPFEHGLQQQHWTEASIWDAIRSAVSGMEAGDQFVFYFAGHGVQFNRGAQQLLLCMDVANSAMSSASTNGCIPLRMLADECRGPFDRVFIFDACRGPCLAENRRRGKREFQRKMSNSRAYREIIKVAQHGTDTGRTTVIWSCADGETAKEDPRLGGGVFTVALLECLKEARDGAGSVLLDEAFVRQVRAKMGRRTSQQPTIAHGGRPIRLELRKTPPAAIDRREAALSALPPPVAPEHKNASVPDTPPTPPAEGKKEGWFERLLRRATMVTAVLAVIFTAIAALEFAGFSTLRLFWPDIGIQRSLPPQQGSGPAMMETGEAAPTQLHR